MSSFAGVCGSYETYVTIFPSGENAGLTAVDRPEVTWRRVPAEGANGPYHETPGDRAGSFRRERSRGTARARAPRITAPATTAGNTSLETWGARRTGSGAGKGRSGAAEGSGEGGPSRGATNRKPRPWTVRITSWSVASAIAS